MIKSEFIELASGKGDAEVYFCIPGNGANIGKFWDFVGLAWVTPITANCKVFATENNSDGTVSVYRADITVPAGGPYLVYCYLQSTGKRQELDTTIVNLISDEMAKEATLVLVQDAVYAGKWVIDPTGKTLTLYKADGVTVLKIIDLTSTTAVIPTFIQGMPRA